MHMKPDCTKLLQTSIDVLMELRANILLLCNDSALAGKRDGFLQYSTMRQVDKWKSFPSSLEFNLEKKTTTKINEN